jgi:hypothetical protein
LKIGGALGFDHVRWDAQTDNTVDHAAACGESVTAVLDVDLVAEEPCRPSAGVGEQRLVGGQFQLEFVMQELRQTLFDFLCFGLWSGESEQVIVGLSYVS